MLSRLARSSVLGLLIASMAAFAAGPQWWQQVYTSNTNSQISLKDQNNASVTAITNPTSASVQMNANTNTQPPTVIVQATASFPVATINTACTYGTDTAALSASDRLTLLTCNASNKWAIAQRISLPVAVEGTACNPTTDGNLAVTSSGIALSCQSGVWRKASGGAGLGALYECPAGGNQYVGNGLWGPSGCQGQIQRNNAWCQASPNYTWACAYIGNF